MIAGLPAAGISGTLVPLYQMEPAKPDIPMPQDPRTQSGSFHLSAPRERVFALFTAAGERQWVPGWDPVLLSGAEERGSAFRTRGHDGVETTWIVIDYSPSEGRVGYARLAQESHIGLVDVLCTECADGGTEVSVRYTLTPLHEAAAARVEEFLGERQYARMLDGWRAATSAVLAGGEAGGQE